VSWRYNIRTHPFSSVTTLLLAGPAAAGDASDKSAAASAAARQAIAKDSPVYCV